MLQYELDVPLTKLSRSNKRGMFVVLGCGGNGITFSMLAAQLLGSALRGERDPDAELFAPA